MTKSCGGKEPAINPTDPCTPPESPCCASGAPADASERPLTHFQNMIPNCLAYAKGRKEAGHPIVGIMCEFAPRELVMAAGGVPICLCGGSAATIPDAEEHLPSNLCPLVKSTFGYHVQKSKPFLEMADLMIAETTCDGKKKMFELMAESRPAYILELPQKQDDPDALDHWTDEMIKLKDHLETRFRVEITEDRLREAIDTMNRERALRRRLAELMKSDLPPITGRELLDLKSSISGIPADLEQYEKALAMLDGKQGCPSVGDRVRVLMTGVPMAHGAERVLDLIEDHGGLVVCMENCTGLKPILEDVDANAADPIRALAEKYFHLPCSVMTRNDRRLESLRSLAREYRAECIIELIWQACITYDIETCLVKQTAETDLGIPYLRIETDYSPSDSARIAVRVEALFETVKNGARAAANRENPPSSDDGSVQLSVRAR